MSANVSAGTVELTSVAAGYEVLDALIKAADVVVLQARHVCSGKFFIVYSGKIADVETAMQTARKVGGEFVEDYLTVANAHPGLFPAMAQTVALPPGKLMSLGVVETKTASSALIAADAAAKAADVTLLKIVSATMLGGKGYFTMTGSVASVETAIEAARASLESRGTFVNASLLPNPPRELFQEI